MPGKENGGIGNYHWIKLKESEKKDKYLDFARVMIKLWNMKVMVIPLVVGALGTVNKGLINRGLRKRGRVETIQTTALLRSDRILRRALETRKLAVTPMEV